MTTILNIDILNTWADKVAKTSDSITDKINSSIQVDENCRNAFNDFHSAIKKIYPSLNIQNCVHMISESIIIGPIQKSLFNSEPKSFNPELHSYEQKAQNTLRQHQIADAPKELNELYELIRDKSLHIVSDTDRQQLIKEIYEDFYKKAFPNRVIRHAKIFGL